MMEIIEMHDLRRLSPVFQKLCQRQRETGFAGGVDTVDTHYDRSLNRDCREGIGNDAMYIGGSHVA